MKTFAQLVEQFDKQTSKQVEPAPGLDSSGQVLKDLRTETNARKVLKALRLEMDAGNQYGIIDQLTRLSRMKLGGGYVIDFCGELLADIWYRYNTSQIRNLITTIAGKLGVTNSDEWIRQNYERKQSRRSPSTTLPTFD